MSYLTSKDPVLLVADAARARVFTVSPERGELVERLTLTNPEVRIADREAVADRPGRTFDRAGHGRHAVSTPVDRKRHLTTTFARSIGRALLGIVGTTQPIVIFAPPKLLGQLRSALPPQLRKAVVGEVAKDLSLAEPKRLEAALLDTLRNR